MFERPATRRSLLRGSAALAAGAATSGWLGARMSSAGQRGPGSRPYPQLPVGAINERMPFDHIVIVMMENHSFDNYFGMLPLRGQPKADGFTFNADGVPMNANPIKPGSKQYQRVFHLSGTCQPNSVNQSWNGTRLQINGGRMDGFPQTDPEAMGYWDESDLPFYYSLANTFCLGNRHYASATAQTYPNRRYLYAGTSSGLIASDTASFTWPAPANGTFMDVMSRCGIDWRNYFTDLPATAMISQNLTNHPQNYLPITQFFIDAATGNLPQVSFVDPDFDITDVVGQQLWNYLRTVPLPQPVYDAVNNIQSRVRSIGSDEENPSDIRIGEAFVSTIVNALLASPAWPRTLMIWTYDEHGGYYDHVAPKRMPLPDAVKPLIGPGDIKGSFDLTGLRLPTVVVSPYSKPHGVTNVTHEHTSIYSTIAHKWNLPAVTYRDANAPTLMDYLDLTRPPQLLKPPPLAAPAEPGFGLADCRVTSATPETGPKGQRRTAAHAGL